MRFKVGDRVQTNPRIKTQPSGWDVDGEMWDLHLSNSILTISSIYSETRPRYFCTTSYEEELWVYEESELIPYKSFFDEAVEL